MTRWFVYKIPANLPIQGITIRFDTLDLKGEVSLGEQLYDKVCRLMEVIRPLPASEGHPVEVQLGYHMTDGMATVVRPFRDDKEMMCQHGREIQLFDDFDQLVDFFAELYTVNCVHSR
jgi:hypothetical protein